MQLSRRKQSLNKVFAVTQNETSSRALQSKILLLIIYPFVSFRSYASQSSDNNFATISYALPERSVNKRYTFSRFFSINVGNTEINL